MENAILVMTNTVIIENVSTYRASPPQIGLDFFQCPFKPLDSGAKGFVLLPRHFSNCLNLTGWRRMKYFLYFPLIYKH